MIEASPSPERGYIPNPMRDAWSEFLQRWSWDWFATLTFRGDPHPEKADKLFRVWVSKLNRKLYGVRWAPHGKGVRWIRASEPQRRGTIHYHALLGGDGLADQRRLDWMDEWFKLAGIARIEVPESASAVSAYCAKYVVKGGEIDLSRSLGRPTQHGLYKASPFRCAKHRKERR